MKRTVTVKIGTGEDQKEVSCFVKTPNQTQLKQAQLEANKVFAKALKEGCLLKAKTEQCLRDQGLWGDEQKSKLEEVTRRIRNNEDALKKGGIKLWGEARRLALDIVEDRANQMRLMGVLNSLDKYTAEGQATDTRFDYLCSVCIVGEDGIPLCKSMDDYQTKSGDGDELINTAASEFSSLFFGYNPKWEEELKENIFLKEHKMVDDKFRLINKEGRLVDKSGKLVNEDGNYIDEEGKLIDSEGNKLDENGEKIVEFSPFLED